MRQTSGAGERLEPDRFEAKPINARSNNDSSCRETTAAHECYR